MTNERMKTSVAGVLAGSSAARRTMPGSKARATRARLAGVMQVAGGLGNC
jgi:hypothetical protein